MDLVAWSELGGGGQCMGVGGVDSPSVFSLPLPGFPSLVRGKSMAAGGCWKVTANLIWALGCGLRTPGGGGRVRDEQALLPGSRSPASYPLWSPS